MSGAPVTPMRDVINAIVVGCINLGARCQHAGTFVVASRDGPSRLASDVMTDQAMARVEGFMASHAPSDLAALRASHAEMLAALHMAEAWLAPGPHTRAKGGIDDCAAAIRTAIANAEALS